ncbi:hypothetical protein AB0E59_40920 [Lentzea sp. NPDC034063]|uniref:hypothetical protein n=1 Tax=unclassified Lentzea TaxID=2643253 RepID=UPI003400BDDF
MTTSKTPIEQAYFTPTPPSKTAILADTKRIADQILRSNPLKNARVDGGLTRWEGAYGGEFAWFGEFYPGDPNRDGKPQRGISLVRDDPQQKTAFAMFDPHPEEGRPLRQRIFMDDADGHPLLHEGENGGWAYPFLPIQLFRADQGGYIQTNQTTDRLIFTGRSAVMGRHVECQGFGTSANNESGLIYMRVTGNNGEVVTAPAFEYTGVGGFTLTADLGADGGVRNATEMTVDVFARKTGGPGDIVIQLRSVFSFSKPSL